MAAPQPRAVICAGGYQYIYSRSRTSELITSFLIHLYVKPPAISVAALYRKKGNPNRVNAVSDRQNGTGSPAEATRMPLGSFGSSQFHSSANPRIILPRRWRASESGRGEYPAPIDTTWSSDPGVDPGIGRMTPSTERWNVWNILASSSSSSGLASETCFNY
jgi:hypothetical protein